MATKRTSSSGAYMSQYDQEVENRLKAIEEAVAELKSVCKAKAEAPVVASTGLEGKFDELVRVLKMNEGLNISKLSKGVL
jgi:hypothetical protein